MKFLPAADTYCDGLPVLLKRQVSESGTWEIGFYPVMYGVRVRVGLVGSMGVAVDYCASDNYEFAGILYTVVLAILETLPESISPNELEKIFPGYEIRPIINDPCWPNLLKLLCDRKSFIETGES